MRVICATRCRKVRNEVYIYVHLVNLVGNQLFALSLNYLRNK